MFAGFTPACFGTKASRGGGAATTSGALETASSSPVAKPAAAKLRTPKGSLKVDTADHRGQRSPSPVREREQGQSGATSRTPGSSRKRPSASLDDDAHVAAVQPAAKPAATKAKPSSNKPTQAERHALQRQEMACIMARITQDGFELKHVEPDGSCLFRALSLQVRGFVVGGCVLLDDLHCFTAADGQGLLVVSPQASPGACSNVTIIH